MSAADDLREAFLTRELTAEQRAQLVAVGVEHHFADGEVVFVEGQPAALLWILLEGELVLERTSGGEAIVMASMTTPGQWAGGLEAWAEGAGYRATGRVVGSARCFAVPSTDLHRLVGEWFPFGGHMIVGIFQTVRNIEAMARQRESLVALGTMAAGLAHELNNPAAASLRAANALGETCDSMLASLTDLARASISADQFVDLDGLRSRALAAEPPSGPMAISDREDEIGSWLADRDVDDGWSVAPVLAASGVDVGWCEEVEAAVGGAGLAGAVRWVSTVVAATDLLDELRDTTARISNLVAAVGSYSQLDRSALQRVDLREGITSTLAMLAHKLHEVDVAVDLPEDLPPLEVHAGELNQVWTNLIDNAVDAMDGAGRLTITARVDGRDVVVEVGDSGPGMPPEVLDRAFEPFFTTKDVGRGTGLGLDITRRIVVDRHGGDVSFVVTPAGTTACVRLPVR